MIHGVAANAAELVLLDFWSPTCPPCMQMKPTVEALLNARYPIRKVDVSQERGVAQQFGVTGVPCFVMLVDGREVDRVVGFTSSERLQQMFAHAKEVVADEAAIRRGGRNNSPDNPSFVPERPEPALPPGAPNDLNSWPPTESNTRPTRGLGGPGRTPPADQPEAPSTSGPFDNKLLSSSVRLTVDDANARSHGTGTIIDARKGQALVITCGHLFRDTKGKSPVTVELFEVGPNGVCVVEKMQGQVLSYDLERDVAFVTIWPTKTVCVAQVAPLGTKVERNDSAASVGCSNGQDPTVMATRVTWLDRYQGPPNVETSGAPVVGRSGGGLFNSQGQLVGVCFAADYEGNKGLYAGLQSIHDELNRLGLHEIYAKPVAGELAAAESADIGSFAAGPSIVRGQVDENAPSTPPTDSITIASQNGPVAIPENLTPTEQAGFDEIISRAATHEVVVIVRPKEAGGESEVMVLDDVSLEFIKALQAHRKGGDATTTR
jgi:thiol-disulfide isomerase/thioredoxin